MCAMRRDRRATTSETDERTDGRTDRGTHDWLPAELDLQHDGVM